jgi:tetratricopeptide (TPR) repeat protein
MMSNIIYFFFILLIGCDKSGRSNISSLENENKKNSVFYDKTYVLSLTEPGLTSYSWNMKSNLKFHSLVEELVVKRLSKSPLDEIRDIAKKISIKNLEKNPDKGLSDPIQLELALSAFQNGKYALSDFYINQILDSKEKNIIFSVKNLKALIAVKDGRLMEAIAIWKEILSQNPSHEAAVLNLGSYAVKYGRFNEGLDILGKGIISWYIDSVILISYRNFEKNEETQKLCDSILIQNPNHKQTLFNCGLFEWQNKMDPVKSKELFQKAMVVKGGPSIWEEEGKKILEKVP